MARHKDVDWNLPEFGKGNVVSWEALHAAIFLDLRDELRRIRAVLECPNATEIPEILRSIRANTNKPRRKRAKRGGK